MAERSELHPEILNNGRPNAKAIMSETGSSGLKVCPIPSSHQRLRQAHILWHQASENYQSVDLFLTNVNSLIQELRNITFILQSEKSTFDDFDSWYAPWQEALRKEKHGRWLVEARNLVVKQGSLAAASHFNVNFLTYDLIEVACLLTEEDFDILTLLKRSDFISIVARLRIDMRDQGDAVLAIERCWSTPELMGSELLEVLGLLYGVLANMLLDAHVHLGSFDCILASQHTSQQHSEFPDRQGRSNLLPCMMRAQTTRTDFYSLSTFAQLSRGSTTLTPSGGPAEAAWHYGFTAADMPKRFDSTDPLIIFEKLVEHSKRMLRKDRSLARHMMLRDVRGNWNGYLFMARDRLEKYLMMHLLAQTIREEGCDAIIEVAETWVYDTVPSMSQLDNAAKLPNRKEAISVVLATRDGLGRHAITPFTRGPFGNIRVAETTEVDKRGSNYLYPIYRVWHEQNQFEKDKGYRTPVWHLDRLQECLCGSSRPFGVCCLPIVDGPNGPIQNSNVLLQRGEVDDAERHARAGVTQYAVWIRQHTALLLNAPVRGDDKKLVTLDCLALEGYLARLERWALNTGDTETPLSAYRRLEEVLEVPDIVRRVVALQARWLFRHNRTEEGILQLDRLGPVTELQDTVALNLVAEYGDQKPDETIRLLDSAIRCACDDNERHSTQLNLAEFLSEHGASRRALDLITTVLGEVDDPGTLRAATTLRWQVSRSEDDFKALVTFMEAEENDDDRLAAASYLFHHDKLEEARHLLLPLMERDHPIACLLIAEAYIRDGNSDAAIERLNCMAINESTPIGVQYGYAQLQALLALSCGKHEIRPRALELLIGVKHFRPGPHIDELIAALEASDK